MPALRERAWLAMLVVDATTGLKPGTELTLELQAQTRLQRGQSPREQLVPTQASWLGSATIGGTTWSPSPREIQTQISNGIQDPDCSIGNVHRMGPPFVTADADKLLEQDSNRIPESKRFELAKTRSGRSVNGIRVGAENARHQVWVNARQHAWEAGGSHVGRGFMEWITGDAPAAKALRAETCIYFVPIMDVDNVVLGAGGKDAVPRDHNRDWAEAPIYPEVAAAQKMIRTIQATHGLDVYIDLHNPGANDPVFFFGPFGYTELSDTPRKKYQRWIEIAAQHIREPVAVQPEYRFATYVTTEEERSRMSSGWVRNQLGDQGISVTLETGWNNSAMTVAGYGAIGAGLARALAEYLSE